MTDVVWLASFPKSGNTWLRLLISAFSDKGEKLDINEMSARGGMASARVAFDQRLMIESGLLTHDEIEALRPRLQEEVARDWRDDEDDERGGLPVRFTKVHDAYTLTAAGEPMLAGINGARGAIIIVRDPRDVAPSLANHMQVSIDEAIAFMADPSSGFCMTERAQPIQLRQKLGGWSYHVATWLDQRDIPVHLVRYEDMQRDAEAALAAVLAFAGVATSREDLERAVAMADFSRVQAQERERGFTEWRDRIGGKFFFRRGEAGAWKSELTHEQVARIETAHGPMMRRLGYDPS
jgi:hypothetical protein